MPEVDTVNVFTFEFVTTKFAGNTLVLYQLYVYVSPAFNPAAFAVKTVEPPLQTFITGAVIVIEVGGRHSGTHNLGSLKQLQSAIACPNCADVAVGPQYFTCDEFESGAFHEPNAATLNVAH